MPTRIFAGLTTLLFTVLTIPISQASQSLGWLAFGDLRGHLEPCGCDPATDLGGLRRLVKVIDQERTLDGSIKVFSLGNLLETPQGHAPSLKNEPILRGVALMMPTASLPGPSDFAQLNILKAFAKQRIQEFKQLNLVLSNSKPEFQKFFAPKIETANMIIFGYTHPTSDNLNANESWTIEKFRSLSGTLNKTQFKVLLFRGPDNLLTEISSNKLFNLIITGNQSPLETIPTHEEKLDESRLTRLKTPPIYQVPLGGQGILRGGYLQNRNTPSFQELLKKKVQIQENPFQTKKHLVTWLTPNIAASPLVTEIFAQYDSAVTKSFQEEGARRLKDLASSPFGGANTCAACHQPIVDSYLKSKHSRAMLTLVEKQKDQDAYCVSCHSVGSQLKGGFVSLEKSPFLANVQCENCHGARKAHSQNPLSSTQMSPEKRSIAREETRQICTNCHNPQHSPNFKYESYWPKIKHSI